MDENGKSPARKPRLIRQWHDSVFARLRAYFLTGIVVTAPIGITLYLTWIFLEFIDRQVGSLVPPHSDPNVYLLLSIPGFGLIVAIVFFTVVGWFARNFLGRLIIRISEYVVSRVPVINTVYKATKQVFETVMTSQSQAFRDVVMFEFPRKGMWTLGFVTATEKGEVQRLGGEDLVNILVPTTPPTSGFLLFVPRGDLIYMKMTVEEALKMILSGGIIVPPDRGAHPAKA